MHSEGLDKPTQHHLRRQEQQPGLPRKQSWASASLHSLMAMQLQTQQATKQPLRCKELQQQQAAAAKKTAVALQRH